MHIALAIASAWLFAYYMGIFTSRYFSRMLTNVVIGISSIAGCAFGLFLGMGIMQCLHNI